MSWFTFSAETWGTTLYAVRDYLGTADTCADGCQDHWWGVIA